MVEWREDLSWGWKGIIKNNYIARYESFSFEDKSGRNKDEILFRKRNTVTFNSNIYSFRERREPDRTGDEKKNGKEKFLFRPEDIWNSRNM